MEKTVIQFKKKFFWEPEAETHLKGLIYFAKECCTDDFRLDPEISNKDLMSTLDELSNSYFFDPSYLYMDGCNILCRRILEQIDKAFKQLGDYNDFDAWEVEKALTESQTPEIKTKIVSGPDYWEPEI